MKGNLVRLTIGDYLYIVPGFISSLTYNIPEDAPWEIALNSPEGESDFGLMETPKLFEISVSFTPIHDFAARLGTTVQTAFITPQAATKDGNTYLGGLSGSNSDAGKAYTDRDYSYVWRTSDGRTSFDSETAANLQLFTS